MIAVTTFPPWAWPVYAEKCLTTWVQCWPDSVLAYYEGDAPPLTVPGVEFRPLYNVDMRAEFLSIKLPEAPNSYLYDAVRFSHKVFAQLDAMKEHGQFWWIDADVEMLSEPSVYLLESLLDASFTTYLGRDTYTETGVVGFNKWHPDFPDFKERYESCYGPEAKIFQLPYWTDCHAFDYARRGGGYNMSPKGRGVEQVLPQSPLGSHMVHHKGRLKLVIEEQAHAV